MKRSIIFAVATALTWGAVAGSAAAGTICTAIEDVATGAILSAEGDCVRRVTPASTFKIAISLMGYDAGVLKDAHHPALPYKESYKAWRPEWKTTTDPTSWIAKSVVWYSQQTTTALGEARFGRYVRDFQYGDQDVSGGHPGVAEFVPAHFADGATGFPEADVAGAPAGLATRGRDYGAAHGAARACGRLDCPRQNRVRRATNRRRRS